MTVSNVVDVHELEAWLAGEQAPLVLDVRWSLGPGSERSAYLAGHVPGAVFVDLDAELAGQPGPDGRHPLPGADAAESLLTRVGLTPGRDVVVYDGGHGMAAARAWWILRHYGCPRGSVRVLSGGLEEWVDAGLPVESGNSDPDPAPSPVRVEPGGMPVVDPTTDAYLGAVEAGALLPYRLLDARAADRYRGEVEPIDPVAGHIPGAVNLPFTTVTRAGSPVPGNVLRNELAAALPEGDDLPLAVYCGSGVSAAVLALCLDEADIPVALYPGSWSHWVQDGERPVTRG